MLGERVPPARSATLVAQARASESDWLGLRRADIRAGYNRYPFLVEHRLHTQSLFEREQLFDLCRRRPELVHLRAGRVPVDEDFEKSISRYRKGLELDDVLDHFEERGAYIIINNPERDSRYREAIEGLVGEVASCIEAMDPGVTWFSTYFFVSSRDAVTPYHMDREMNFLFQLAGTKTVRLWRPDDPAVMTEAQKDELLSYAAELRPPYHPSLDPKATAFELRPGLGVHHPFIAPHIVNTSSDFSISLALTFRTVRTDLWTDAHRLNHSLRSLGFHPRAVGRNMVVDRTKASVTRLLRLSRRTVRNVGRMLQLRPSSAPSDTA